MGVFVSEQSQWQFSDPKYPLKLEFIRDIFFQIRDTIDISFDALRGGDGTCKGAGPQPRPGASGSSDMLPGEGRVCVGHRAVVVPRKVSLSASTCLHVRHPERAHLGA